MTREGKVPDSAQMTITVFWPNPLGGTFAKSPMELISKEFKVSYLERLDPIYHELCFIDEKGVRHQIIGLAYWVQETMEPASGVDAQV